MSDKKRTFNVNFKSFSTSVFIDGEKVSATDINLSFTENLIQFEGAYRGILNYELTNNESSSSDTENLQESSEEKKDNLTVQQFKK